VLNHLLGVAMECEISGFAADIMHFQASSNSLYAASEFYARRRAVIATAQSVIRSEMTTDCKRATSIS
jgi:hypothetical protein